jgi:hypothetical protein
MPVSSELEERIATWYDSIPEASLHRPTTLKNKANPASQASPAGEACDGEKAKDFNGVESVEAQNGQDRSSANSIGYAPTTISLRTKSPSMNEQKYAPSLAYTREEARVRSQFRPPRPASCSQIDAAGKAREGARGVVAGCLIAPGTPKKVL